MVRVSCVLGGTATTCMLMLTSASALAQGEASLGATGAVEDAHVEHVNYAYAQVLRVVPVYREIQIRPPSATCADVEVPEDTATSTGSSGMQANGVGAMIQTGFAAAAPSLPMPSDEARSEPARCDGAENGVTITRHEGYDVEYRYRGEVFVSRLDYDPGDRLRIRVAVVPAAEGQSVQQDGWQTASRSW